MRWIAPLLISTSLLAGCSLFSGTNESFSTLLERSGRLQPQLTAYEQGKRNLQLGNPGLAIAAFQRELAQNPNSIPAINGLAVAYDRLGRSDVAQRYLDQALTLDSNSVVTLNNLAYLHLTHGETAVAVAYGERARAAASTTTDMPLPAAIATALSRNLEFATALALSELRDMTGTLTMPDMSSDVERLGENEWQLLISPSKSAELRDSAPTRAPARPIQGKRGDWKADLPISAKIKVSNGTGRRLMASRFADYLSDHGLKVRQLSNAENYSYRESVIYYNPDQREFALALSHSLPFPVKLAEAKKGLGEIQIILGSDLLGFDDNLRAT